MMMVMMMMLLLLLLLLQYFSIVVQLLGGFNNIAFLHDLTSRPGFAIVEHHSLVVSTPASKSP
jgi:hypothetical protein